jgi:amino acid adenylation domain-containing protein
MAVQGNTINEAFEAQVRLHGDKTVVMEEQRSYTYRQLNAMVAELANQLPLSASGEQIFVGVVLDHGAWMIAALLAALRTGAAYVPAEPTFPRERIHFMMRQCAVPCIITQKEYAGLFAGLEGVKLVLVDPAAPAPESAAAGMGGAGTHAGALRAYPQITEHSAAYVLYTSGTTGVPKGVVIEHGNVCNYARAFAAEYAPTGADVMLQNSVCTFDIFVEEVYPLLLSGGALAVPGAALRDDLPAELAFAGEHGVTMISGFPYLLADINKLGAGSVPASVRLLISGGDVLRASYITSLLGHDYKIYNTYGPSETTVCCTYYDCTHATPLPDGTYPVGRAVQGVQVRVLNAQGAEAAPGEVGEICIYGNGVGRGYRDPKADVAHAFGTTAAGERCYRSGDLGYVLPSGNLAFTQRKDEQVMIWGKRVEPQEVENRMAAAPGVQQAAVVASFDGQGLAHLHGYVVPSAPDFSVEALRAYLLDYLTAFMVPETIELRASLPHTASGKLDRKAL